MKTEYKLLLIEDNPGDARLIQEFLKEKGLFELKWVEKLSDGLELLKSENFDAILLDIALPDSSGIDTVQKVTEKYPELPIIILTGYEDEDFAIKTLQSGAQDYLVKGLFDSELLFRSIKYAVERKRVEEKLLDTERRYRELFENANVMIQSMRSDGSFIEVNGEWLRVLKYSIDEVRRMKVFDIIDDSCSDYYYNVFKRVLAGEPQKNVEARFIAKDGRKIDVEGNIFSRTINGKVVAIYAIFRDVTDKKDAERRLKESEKRYRTTFEHTGTAMLMIEGDTTISLVNKKFEELSGYKREEIEGKMSWTQFVHPDDLDIMKKYHYGRRIGEKTPETYEFRAIARDGNVRNMLITVGLIPGTEKTVASLIDITKLKRVSNLLKAISEINELVARGDEPEEVLEAVCDKLTGIFDAVSTAINSENGLKLVKSCGEIESFGERINSCPAILKSMKGAVVRMSSEESPCRECSLRRKYVLALPLYHEKVHGVVVFHSNLNFSDEEVQLLQKLSENIAFALNAYRIRQDRRKAIEQLTANLVAFDKSADRLRNPLAAIIGAIELKEELGNEKIIEIISEQAKRIKDGLDMLRKEEIKTFRLTEEVFRNQ